MITRKFNSHYARRGEAGQTLVEFSLVLLMFLVILFGTIETARLMLTCNTLAGASRAGVRYAMVHGDARADCVGCATADGPSGPGDTGDIESVVRTFAASAGLAAGSLTVVVAYPAGSNKTNLPVTVTTSYQFSPVLGLLPFTTVPIPLSSTSQGTICF